jgi:hypothetical protein
VPSVKAGKKVDLGTGGLRHADSGKGRFDLISYWAVLRYAQHMEKGITEGGYEPRNWEKGVPVSRCASSALRHLLQFSAGLNDEDHLAAAIWNLCCIAHFEAVGPEALLDLPRYRKEKPK